MTNVIRFTCARVVVVVLLFLLFVLLLAHLQTHGQPTILEEQSWLLHRDKGTSHYHVSRHPNRSRIVLGRC